MDKFESKVKKGGILIYDNYGIHKPVGRKDIEVYSTNAMDMATELNMQKTFNMIILGGLLKIVPMVSLESVMNGLKKTLPERHYKLLPVNEEAIKKGMEIIKKVR
jgi:2-oxoglutarate ferredoxin oxidoreductase subunit gamma